MLTDININSYQEVAKRVIQHLGEMKWLVLGQKGRKAVACVNWWFVSPARNHGNCRGQFPFYRDHLVVVVVVVLLFLANNTAMERYNIMQNKLLEATRAAIRLIGLVALIMAYKVNKCMWPTGVRGQGSDRGMHHGATRTCRFRGVGSVLIIIKTSLQRLTGFTPSATSS